MLRRPLRVYRRRMGCQASRPARAHLSLGFADSASESAGGPRTGRWGSLGSVGGLGLWNEWVAAVAGGSPLSPDPGCVKLALWTPKPRTPKFVRCRKPQAAGGPVSGCWLCFLPATGRPSWGCWLLRAFRGWPVDGTRCVRLSGGVSLGLGAALAEASAEPLRPSWARREGPAPSCRVLGARGWGFWRTFPGFRGLATPRFTSRAAGAGCECLWLLGPACHGLRVGGTGPSSGLAGPGSGQWLPALQQETGVGPLALAGAAPRLTLSGLETLPGGLQVTEGPFSP